jgi:type II secretory ATPase GspE/PulE/Tfp pilus assembly ATPase PilB-like protein
LTGHLVLSTLHTLDVFGVLPRLINLGIEPYLLPAAFSVAVSQRLVRRLCDDCKKKVKISEKVREFLREQLDNLPEEMKREAKLDKALYVWKAVGCKKCNNAGFTGRIGVFEVLEMTDFLADLILTKPSETEIAKEAIRQGMITIRQDALLKALAGVTTLEEALRTT